MYNYIQSYMYIYMYRVRLEFKRNAVEASAMLRQLLTTATHDSNPALMQFAQSAVPDLQKIWGFEATREHLRGLLAQAGAKKGRKDKKRPLRSC